MVHEKGTIVERHKNKHHEDINDQEDKKAMTIEMKTTTERQRVKRCRERERNLQ